MEDVTRITELMTGVAEDFEGATEFLCAEGGVECEEDLNHVCGVVFEGPGGGSLGDCTHLDGLYWVTLMD